MSILRRRAVRAYLVLVFMNLLAFPFLQPPAVARLDEMQASSARAEFFDAVRSVDSASRGPDLLMTVLSQCRAGKRHPLEEYFADQTGLTPGVLCGFQTLVARERPSWRWEPSSPLALVHAVEGRGLVDAQLYAWQDEGLKSLQLAFVARQTAQHIKAGQKQAEDLKGGLALVFLFGSPLLWIAGVRLVGGVLRWIRRGT